MSNWEKIVNAKTALAKRGAQLRKAVADAGNSELRARIPPGQTQVKNFPVLDMGIRPEIDLTNWTLRLFGLVEQELTLNWDAFQALPQVEKTADFHCVTRWTQLDMDWQGVAMQTLLNKVKPTNDAHYVTLHGYDGYTTNLPLSAIQDDDVLIAHSVLGAPLSREHGGPARIIVPKRYAWKGAKWIKAIEFHQFDRPGFWEVRGYHNEGFPFAEQRFTDDDY